MCSVLWFVLLYFRDVGVGWGGGGVECGVSCFHGHLNKCPLGDLNKCPLGDLNKSPCENYLEGGGSEEIIKSTRFCKVHYVLNSDINVSLRTKGGRSEKKCGPPLLFNPLWYSQSTFLSSSCGSSTTWNICCSCPRFNVFSLVLLQLIHYLIRVWNMKCPVSSRWLTSGPVSPGSERLSRLTSGILFAIINWEHSF